MFMFARIVNQKFNMLSPNHPAYGKPLSSFSNKDAIDWSDQECAEFNLAMFKTTLNYMIKENIIHVSGYNKNGDPLYSKTNHKEDREISDLLNSIIF